MKNIIVLFLLSILSLNGFSQNIDINILKKINANRNKSLDATFKFISNGLYPVSVGTPLVLFSVGLIKKDSLLKQRALYMGKAALVSLFITAATKRIVKRERPFITYPFIEKGALGRGYSFPSGHTSAAFATATSLSITYPKWYIIAPSFLWAGATAYSRIHLGVHYPSDILAGAIIGSGSAFLTHKANKWLRQKRAKKR